jgi:hypothetical protein
VSEYQTDEKRSAASLVLENARLEVALEEAKEARLAAKADGTFGPQHQEAIDAATADLQAARGYWRPIRSYFEALAAEEQAAREAAGV